MKVTGSLQVKNRMYQAVLSYYDEDTQKWKQKWKTTKIRAEKGNKKIAEKVLKEIIENFKNEMIDKSNSNVEVIQENSVRKTNYNRNDNINLLDYTNSYNHLIFRLFYPKFNAILFIYIIILNHHMEFF